MSRLALLIVLASTIACSEYRGDVPRLYGYRQANLQARLAKSADGGNDTIFHLRRNSTGDTLYVYLLGRGAKLSVARLSTRGSERVPITDLGAADQFFSDDGAIAALVRKGQGTESHGTYVVNGTELRGGRFDVAPDGEWFLWGPVDGPSEIRRTVDPSHLVAVSNVKGERIFAWGNKLFIWGRPAGNQRDEAMLVYQTFKVVGDTVQADGEGRLAAPSWPWRGDLRVIDMDSLTGAALIEQRRDNPFCSRWFMWESDRTGLRDVGCSADYGVFLRQDPLSARVTSANDQAATTARQ